MVDYREILRLQSLGYNITQIAGSLRSSRNTVREVERLADEKGIRWPLGEKVTNPQLYVLLYPERQKKANVYLEPDCAANSHFLRTAGPHFPDSPGHIKRTAWDISRAEGTPPH